MPFRAFVGGSNIQPQPDRVRASTLFARAKVISSCERNLSCYAIDMRDQIELISACSQKAYIKRKRSFALIICAALHAQMPAAQLQWVRAAKAVALTLKLSRRRTKSFPHRPSIDSSDFKRKNAHNKLGLVQPTAVERTAH